MQDAPGEMVPQHRDVYDAISPEKLVGTMEGKVAFVTGAGRGIGKAIAIAFAQAGADVALLARTASQLESVATTIRNDFQRRAVVFPADATDATAVRDALAATVRELGGVDIAVANAGVNLFRPLVYTPLEEWWWVQEVNVKGQLLLAQEAIKLMREKASGTVIFNASRAAVVDVAGLSAYCASKAAIVRAAGCVQLELDAEEKDIHVFSIHPGGVKTDMTPDSLHPDMEKLKPGTHARLQTWLESPDFGESAELSAWTCVYLATGRARELRGLYLDVRYDIEATVKQADIVQKEQLNLLQARFLGGSAI